MLFELVYGRIKIPESFAGGTAEFNRCRMNQQESAFSDDLADLICKMLNPDPSLRITIDEVLAHPWMTVAPMAPWHPWKSIEATSLWAAVVAFCKEDGGWPRCGPKTADIRHTPKAESKCGPVGLWDVSEEMVNMQFLFANCHDFSEVISAWDQRSENLDAMLMCASIFNPTVPPSRRNVCDGSKMHGNISYQRDTCERSGCCFDPVDTPGPHTWCFHPDIPAFHQMKDATYTTGRTVHRGGLCTRLTVSMSM